jgi:cytosine/adenosine deaminase-related metal-dependent hydrolase
MVLFRGLVEDVEISAWFNDYIWPLESNLTPEDVYWGSLLGMAEMIEAGVTHVADHYFYMDQVALAVETAGLRSVGMAKRTAASPPGWAHTHLIRQDLNISLHQRKRRVTWVWVSTRMFLKQQSRCS